MRHQRPNATMTVGDTFPSRDEDGLPVEVTVLKPPEPCADRFGRELWRVWGQRSDTGTEGWLSFGWAEDLPTPAPPKFEEGDRVRIVDLNGAPATILADILAADFVGVVASCRRRVDGEPAYRVDLGGERQLSFREHRLAPVEDLPTPAQSTS